MQHNQSHGMWASHCFSYSRAMNFSENVVRHWRRRARMTAK
ncbi:Protein of unknown function [Pyronema omphalodes CBS 100304]|uniref:Uncharacterized protein n=1 Tax=Pyronema omphalodes (strain CBS 100304) TaxID=1076935 RepID=U4LKZ7_PYROM|nr:Protein of unknown function [Pyronema omphalodes CBS 100304]